MCWFYTDNVANITKVCGHCVNRIKKEKGSEGVMKVIEELRIERRNTFILYLISAVLGLVSAWAFMSYIGIGL